MYLAMSRIGAAVTRTMGVRVVQLLAVTAGSALLLAAADSPQPIAPQPTEAGPAVQAVAPANDGAAAAATDAAADGAATYAAPRPARLAGLVTSLDDVEASVAADTQLGCLASAVYFESRGEPLEGQLAVAQAILNRVDSGRYAASICAVIRQPGQFTFNHRRAPQQGEDWRTAQAIAVIAARELWKDMAPRAMSFHANYVAPGWHGKTRVTQIGRHIFYR
jgi:spore germination cell wall hydrolase CwlJ-like protein